MQQLDLTKIDVLKDFMSNFDNQIQRKDIVIKTLINENEKLKKDLTQTRELLTNLCLFMKDLGEV